MREKTWSRIHLIPLLEAEHDRDEYRRAAAENTVEAAIMKRHKFWRVRAPSILLCGRQLKRDLIQPGASVYFHDRGDNERVV
jgi:NADH dehydrogenase (ubiquinone) 1 alpha subcomplex subunit 13